MKKKTLAAVFALGLAGLMLTACGSGDDMTEGTNDTTANDTRMTDEAAEQTSDVSVITGEDNPGRSRDIDGDGFIEDVVDGAGDIVDDVADGVADGADNVINGAEDIVDGVVDGAEDLVDGMDPDEHDETTVTTTVME